MRSINEIIEKLKSKRKSIDQSNIIRAYEFAKSAHLGVKRRSGEPYITHPLEVAYILADLGMDDASIQAALLHDVVEDTRIPIEEIELAFGKDVANLVAGETNLGHLKFISDRDEYQVENLRKMFIAMAHDMRVILIKLADRLHNMRTMKYQTPEKRIRKSRETLEVYAPVAARLGMGQMRGELEDLAFQWVYPKQYEWLKEQTHVAFKEGDRLIAISKRKLSDALVKEGIKAKIEGRTKHRYSLWKKLQRPEYNNELSKIPDLIAIRVILEKESIEQCYIILGIIHQIWTPLAGRVSDYIAVPKGNGYRSLHTKVFVEKGKIMEVQIRTKQMHEQAEYGIASHIIYEQVKLRRGITSKQLDKGVVVNKEQLNWIKELTQWQKEAPDSDSFLIGLKHDLFKDRIFVYTPKGDVKDLPLGSTPVDFAYSIHSEIGDRTIGARVDGHIVPLNYQLRNGEIVEIMTTKERKNPSPDWLRFVQTNLARKHIQRIANIQSIEKENQLAFEEQEETSTRPGAGQELTSGSLLTNPMSLVNRVQTVLKNRLKKKPVSSRAAIVVHGLEGVATKLAKCCNPLPGEDIVGFVTDEQHVSVHSAACKNVSNITHKEKHIPVAWSLPPGLQKAVRMKVEMIHREGALRDITKVLADAKVAIEQFEQLPTKEGILKIQFVVGFKNETQRSQLYSKLQRVRGVHNVE